MSSSIARDARLLLDTWVIVKLLQGKAAGQAILERYYLMERASVPFISVVTVGELLAFAQKDSWAGARRTRLEELIAQLVVVDINSRDVLDAFAEVSTFLRARGRVVGDNDRWIAATARVLDAVLLSGDQDFAPLHPGLVRCELIDERDLLLQ